MTSSRGTSWDFCEQDNKCETFPFDPLGCGTCEVYDYALRSAVVEDLSELESRVPIEIEALLQLGSNDLPVLCHLCTGDSVFGGGR
jgi:hypothetical protein